MKRVVQNVAGAKSPARRVTRQSPQKSHFIAPKGPQNNHAAIIRSDHS
jgi:hypothetical protein